VPISLAPFAAPVVALIGGLWLGYVVIAGVVVLAVLLLA